MQSFYDCIATGNSGRLVIDPQDIAIPAFHAVLSCYRVVLAEGYIDGDVKMREPLHLLLNHLFTHAACISHSTMLYDESKDGLTLQCRGKQDGHQLFHCTYTFVSKDSPTCFVCGRCAPKACGKCRHATYCGPECQRTDWARHKIQCSALSSRHT